LSWPRLVRERRRPGRAPFARSGGETLAGLIAALPEDARTSALTHSSWAEDRVDSYERLALLGDSVLGLSIADELYRTLPGLDAGSLTKILNQAVSGTSCAAVGRELGIPEMLIAADPGGPEGTQTPARLLLEGERPLPEITEAMIGACFIEFGFERTAAAVVEAFSSRIETVQSTRTDFKSALQENVARSGGVVEYEVVDARGPAHQRTYEVAVTLQGREIGRGEGRSKKAAGQAAAERALETLDA
jgi:ribonuclease-3